jgi:succinoglycan biosynthesis transport protein ExoP
MATEEQYLDEEEGNLGDLIDALKRRKKQALITATIVFVVGVVGIFAWPTAYTSTATILLEEPEVPETLVQTTVTTFAAQQVQYINQRVMTRTNLANIIEKFNLYEGKRRYTPTLLLTEEVQENMSLDLINVELTDPTRGVPIISTIAFTLSFEDPSPETAQKVANELVSLYMEENVRSRTVQTVETREFLSQESDRLETRVRELEQQVAQFKEDNEGSLPEIRQVNLGAMQRLDQQLLEVDRELNRIGETRIIIDSQLAQVQPTQSQILPDGTASMSPENQLKSLQTKLATYKGVYSEDHPDVVRAEREIKALRQQTGLVADFTETSASLSDARAKLAMARENYSEDHPEVVRLQRIVDGFEDTMREQRYEVDTLIKPDNPAFIQLTAQKETLLADENSLEAQRRVLQTRLDDYEALMLKAPRVEQELGSLLRKLQSETSQYYALRERQFGAEMGEALETQSKGERFVLVEPPNMPLEPSSPNHVILLLLLVVLAPAVGIALVLLVEAMDRSVRGVKMITSIQGSPPLAEIPLIQTQAEIAHDRRTRVLSLLAAPVALLLLALTIHFLLRPLDVMWFVALRKLGL